MYTTNEGDGTVEVCARIVMGSIGPGRTVVVMFATRDGSAEGEHPALCHLMYGLSC